jgi:hypothetical protein
MVSAHHAEEMMHQLHKEHGGSVPLQSALGEAAMGMPDQAYRDQARHFVNVPLAASRHFQSHKVAANTVAAQHTEVAENWPSWVVDLVLESD